MSRRRSGIATPAALVGSLGSGRRRRGKARHGGPGRLLAALPGSHRRRWSPTRMLRSRRRRWLPWRRPSRAEKAMDLARKAGTVVSAVTFLSDLVSETRRAGGGHEDGRRSGGQEESSGSEQGEGRSEQNGERSSAPGDDEQQDDDEQDDGEQQDDDGEARDTGGEEGDGGEQ